LKFQRTVEYCQWIETYTDTKGENGTVFRTFYYHLGWHSTPVNSMFFDQPIAHHNPLTIVLPSAPHQVSSARLGMYHLSREIVSTLADNYVPYNIQGSALENFGGSLARTKDFHYIGNGEFYYAHNPGFAETLLTLLGRAAEGSLDVQLTELLKRCNAGDVRVTFAVVEPSVVSAIGKLLDSQGHIDTYTTSSGYAIRYAKAQRSSARELMDSLRFNASVMLFLARAFLVCMCWADVALFFNVHQSLLIICALSFSGGALGAIWCTLWGFDIISTIMLLQSLAIVPYVISQPSTKPKYHEQ